MGCVKGLKKAAKRLRKEIEPDVMKIAGNLVFGMGRLIEDGLEKSDAREASVLALQALTEIKETAARVAVEMAHEAVSKLGETPDELGVDDTADAPDLA